MYQGIEYQLEASSAAELVDQIEELIVNGELPAGSRLPPVRSAAAVLGLAANTVAAAYRTLSDRGFTVGKGRLGTFVRERDVVPSSLVPELPPGVIDLASGIPDRRLLPDLAPVLASLGGSTTTYGDPSVAPELGAAVAKILAAEGVSPDHLAVTGGAVDALERVLGAWLRPGDAVAVEDPGWFAIVDLLRAMSLVPVPVPVDEKGMSPAGLERIIGRVSAVVLTPRAQNPTGAAVTSERAGTLASILAGRPRVGVIEDDHMGPTSGVGVAPVGGRGERWAFVRSFSKDLGPDLRVAVTAGDETTINRVVARQVIGPGWISHILQRTVATLLVDPQVNELLVRAREEYASRRRALIGALDELGLQASGVSGLNVWVPVSDEVGAVDAAQQAGYAVRAGRRFRHASPPGVRVTISEMGRDDPRRLALALAAGPSPGTRMV